MKTNSLRNSKLFTFLPELLFLIIALFCYLPYFLYTPTAYLLNDIFAYLYLAKDFSEALLPLSDYNLDLPYGYGFFISLIFKFGGNINTVVFVQTILNLTAFLFLITEIKKWNFSTALIAALLLALFVILSDNMLWNILLYTESLYITGLVLLSIFLLRWIRTENKLNLWIVSTIILALLFIRSNALFLFFIHVAIFFYALLNKDSLWKQLVLSILFIMFFSSLANYFVKGHFYPGESQRMVKLLNDTFVGKTKESQALVIDEEYLNRPQNYRLIQAFKVFTNLKNAEMANFYYYRIPRAYKSFTKDNLEKFVEQNINYKVSKNTKELIAFTLRDYNFDKKAFQNIESLTNIDQRPRQFWLYSNHLIHLMRVLWRNWLFVLAFYLFYFISLHKLWLYLKAKGQIRKEWLAVLALGSVHFVSMLLLAVIAPRDTSLSRYVIVTEFAAYVCIAFGAVLTYSEWKSRNSSLKPLDKAEI